MAEEPISRNEFISKIGNFFIVVGLFAIIVFVSTDISHNDPGRKANATQTFIVAGVQALQTRDAGAALAQLNNLPTPTIVPLQGINDPNENIAYLPAFCVGSIGLLLGWFFKRISAPPAKPSNRFEGIRKWQQKQREAKAKKEAEKKEKEAKKKAGGK